MERNFPEKSLYTTRIEADFENVKEILLPILMELNNTKLQNKALIKIQQSHKYGKDTAIYFQDQYEEQHVVLDEPNNETEYCDTKIILNWDDLASPRGHNYVHEIEIEYGLGFNLTVRFDNFLIDRESPRNIPPKIKMYKNPRFREDLLLLMDELLSNPDLTRIRR